MRFDIERFQGAGPIRFGMTREEVARALGEVPLRFRKTAESPSETDEFRSLGVFVFYDSSDRCEAIELPAPMPGRPGSVMYFERRPMNGERYQHIVGILRAMDPLLEEDGAGAISHSLGIGIYTLGDTSSAGAQVEAAIAFRKGYYEG